MLWTTTLWLVHLASPRLKAPLFMLAAPTPDPYALLGLDRDATLPQIRAAYRRRARRLHPDVNSDDPDAVDKFRELTEAFEALTTRRTARRPAVDTDWVRREARERARRSWGSGDAEQPGSRRRREPSAEEQRADTERRRKYWRGIKFDDVWRDHMPVETPLGSVSRSAFSSTLEGAVQAFVRGAVAEASASELAARLNEAEQELLQLTNLECLEVEIADLRHRAKLHRERTRWLEAELARAEKRAAAWHGATASTSAERLGGMERELAFLEQANRIRERSEEQRVALRRLRSLEAALMRRAQWLRSS